MSQQISWERIGNFKLQPKYCLCLLLDCHIYNVLLFVFVFGWVVSYRENDNSLLFAAGSWSGCS